MRNRPLRSPRGKSTRPSTGRVRESMFNLIENRIELEGAHVLDLFAGSGALGFEAISRGAGHATFLDNDRDAIRIINQNARSLGVEDRVTVVAGDVSTFLKRHTGAAYRLVMADPPYDFADLEGMVRAALGIVLASGLLVLEHDTKAVLAGPKDRMVDSRRYGRSVVSIFE